jgi:hypothetical protein
MIYRSAWLAIGPNSDRLPLPLLFPRRAVTRVSILAACSGMVFMP